MRPSDSANILTRFLSHERESSDSDAAHMFVLFMRFYSEQRATGLSDGPNSDMLLFQYGCYDWGKGEFFELNLTRQFIVPNGEDDTTISQLQMTFRYKPNERLRDLPRHNLWCRNPDDVDALRRDVLSSPALALTAGRDIEEFAIEWELV